MYKQCLICSFLVFVVFVGFCAFQKHIRMYTGRTKFNRVLESSEKFGV